MKDFEMNTISVNDILHTLRECERDQKHEGMFDHMLTFASELTGLSEDALMDAMHPQAKNDRLSALRTYKDNDEMQGYPKLFIYQNPDCLEDVEIFTLGAIVGDEACAFYMGNQGSFVRANEDIYVSHEILNDDGIPVYDEWALNNLFFDINSKGRLDRWVIKALCASDTQVLNDDMKVFIQRILQKGMTVEKAMEGLYAEAFPASLLVDATQRSGTTLESMNHEDIRKLPAQSLIEQIQSASNRAAESQPTSHVKAMEPEPEF